MELRQLRTFLTVGRLLSFNRAAEHLHYAQSTVSAQIKGLEDEFGRPLFDRLGKAVALTEAGRLLLQYAEKLLVLEEETRAQISGWQEPQGLLTLRVPQSIGLFFMPQVIQEFSRQYPKIGLKINSCAFDTLRQEFRAGVTDLAFLIADSVNSAEIIAEPLGITRIATVCAAGHRLRDKANVTIHDFASETVLLPQHDCSYRMDFEQELMANNVHPAALHEMNSVATIKRCVMAGVGISLMPEIIVRDDLKAGRLSELPWPESRLEKAVFMLHHRDKWISPPLAAFIEQTRCVICPLLQ